MLPESVHVDGSNIFWIPTIADTGIKSFRFIVRSKEYVDTLNYPITVFDSANYNDFIPIQKGFYWIYQGAKKETDKIPDGHGNYLIQYPDMRHGSFTEKIEIDSIWNCGDSLFFKVNQKFSFFHGDSSLGDSNANFVAIYFNNEFFSLPDYIISDIFRFRYLTKQFTNVSPKPIPGYPQYYDGNSDSLIVENDFVVRKTSRQLFGSQVNSEIYKVLQINKIWAPLDFMSCIYQSDIGLKQLYQNVKETAPLPTGNPEISVEYSLKLIEYNFGSPVKLN